MLGGDDSVPYKQYIDDSMEKVYNTKVPYGNVDDWSEEDLTYFFNHNLDWYCKESGVSLWSKNTEIDSYNIAKSEYQKELAKKNNSIGSLDTISSEIV